MKPSTPKKKKLPLMSEMFSPYYETESVGQWIGFSSCYVCGAVIIISKNDPWTTKRHYQWHKKYN